MGRILQQSSGAIEILRRDRAQRFVGRYRLTWGQLMCSRLQFFCAASHQYSVAQLSADSKSHAGGVASRSAASSAKKCSAVGRDPQLIVVLSVYPFFDDL